MATKVTLQITSLDPNGKKVTDKISYVNPTATNAQLKQFASKLENLTNNTATNYKKITEEDIT